MTTAKLQPQYQTWLTNLCRSFVARIRSIPEVVMVAVQPLSDNGLPDFFILLDDLQPAEKSTARYQVTLAVLNLRGQYANPWLLDYYFLNLEDYRPDNANISWRDFVTVTETIIYVRQSQPFDTRIIYWAGASAGMAGCAFVGLLIAVSNRTSPGNLLGEGWQALLYLLPLLLLGGWLAASCTVRTFRRASLWSNGEGVFSAWLEALVESGVVVGGTVSTVAIVPLLSGIRPEFLGDLGNNLVNIREGIFWQLPPPLNLLAYFNSSTSLALFSGLVVGLILGFSLALLTGWLVKRWLKAFPLRQETPLTDSLTLSLLKYLALVLTFAALFFACYSLWPAPAPYPFRY